MNFKGYHRSNSIINPVRNQSVMDPDKSVALRNYHLDLFKNSIWENFLGSMIQISKIVEKDGSSMITNRITNKLGPI